MPGGAAKAKKGSIPPLVMLLLETGSVEPTIPYEYRIQKSAGTSRTLSIVHPSSQLKFIPFYNENQ
jgi:hypothetical protein